MTRNLLCLISKMQEATERKPKIREFENKNNRWGDMMMADYAFCAWVWVYGFQCERVYAECELKWTCAHQFVLIMINDKHEPVEKNIRRKDHNICFSIFGTEATLWTVVIIIWVKTIHLQHFVCYVLVIGATSRDHSNQQRRQTHMIWCGMKLIGE